MHYNFAREPVEIVHDLDAHTDPGVTYGSQKEFSAVIMGTVGCLRGYPETRQQRHA
jgi:hypothetical protein